MNFKTSALAACATLLATSAFAEDGPKAGFYGFLGASYSVDAFRQNNQFNSTSGVNTNSSSFRSSQKGAGFQLGTGYRFSKNSAIELIYMHLPDTNTTSTSVANGVPSAITDTTNYSNDALALTWLYGVPITPTLNPFTRAGVTFTYSKGTSATVTATSSTSNSFNRFNTGYLLGLGNDFYLTQRAYDGPALRTEMFLQSNANGTNTGTLSFATSLVMSF